MLPNKNSLDGCLDSHFHLKRSSILQFYAMVCIHVNNFEPLEGVGKKFVFELLILQQTTPEVSRIMLLNQHFSFINHEKLIGNYF